ncbi:Adaptin N terminal region family protein [Histomonas meleagridis]|uniref:Adaptin N terminal region family protein n=1 Tax=Histomonas meleagridis TaxID=135588 RepID=UPI00355AAF3B|nr:Adaptin N terminal region family protein [Histomonas meleagridis]KAH0804226.1 Adaptin N terminal region family protein [Histomonas meleagridis]
MAANKVVSLMRGGENMSALFSSMLRCVRTEDLQLKKLIYLYLVTYSSQEPEQSIMTVSTFVSDCADPNPIVRALALRTMPRIKLETVAEHMILPLKKCLKDPEAYVRKTAVLAVSKIYDIIPEAIENSQILKDLLECLKDENPMVVSNTTAALFEINERRANPIFSLNENNVTPIISAMTQCSGWVQTLLLDALAQYRPANDSDASFLIDRLLPFLKHANPAVVIGSFKCIYRFMEYDKRTPEELFPQIIPPFITLISSSDPEIQFVTLRILSLFVIKYPKLLSNQIRFFFCKYNDPSYVKLEKLDIIVHITTPKNFTIVIDELEEYCNSVDVHFVRKAINSLKKIALKVEVGARRCVDVLVKLVESKAEYAVEEAIIVIADILRHFPGMFESIIQIVCSNLEQIKDSRAKAAAIWILGEYNSIIENVDVLLDPFLDSFQDEIPEVQLQILTALVKVYVRNPEQSHDQLQFALNAATKESVMPDVRNRAMIYWRLLSTVENSLSEQTVNFSKQTRSESVNTYDPAILEELIKNMGSISGVLHVTTANFVRRIKYLPDEDSENELETENISRNWTPINLEDPNLDLFVDWEYMTLYLRIFNKSQNNIHDFALAFNKNWAGITLKELPYFPESLDYGDSCEINIKLSYNESQISDLINDLQIALRTNLGTKIFNTNINVIAVVDLPENTSMEALQNEWKKYSNDTKIELNGNLADEKILSERKLFVMSKENNAVNVAFNLPSKNVFIAKLQQISNNNVVVLVHGNEKFFGVIQQSAESLFCA